MLGWYNKNLISAIAQIFVYPHSLSNYYGSSSCSMIFFYTYINNNGKSHTKEAHLKSYFSLLHNITNADRRLDKREHKKKTIKSQK